MTTDSEQQELNGNLVKNEVYANVSEMVEFILSRSEWGEDKKNSAPFGYDDIENNYSKHCETCGEIETHCNHDKAGDSHEFEAAPQEIYEWWVVSEYLKDKLKEKGEPVIDGYPNLWGRTCTGQAKLLDNVITEIQKETGYGSVKP
jgi:hypothetical protein